MLPRDVLNNGVIITLIATEPVKNGVNDQALCWVPLNRKAGRCQKPQIAPRISPAQIGVNFLCIRGSARPRQPNSSTGPLIAANTGIATNKRLK